MNRGKEIIKNKRAWWARLFYFPRVEMHGFQYHRNTLRFEDKKIEGQYKEASFYQNKKQIRVALLFAVLIFMLLGYLDYYLFPGTYMHMWSIRLTTMAPFTLLLVLLSYTKDWRIVQPTAAFAILIAGITNIAIVTEHVGYLGSVYYIGMVLFLLYGYTVLRVRFLWMVRAGLGMILFYEVIALFISGVPPDVFLINNIFLIAANVIGMFASYTIEYYSRKDFIQNRLFMRSADSLALSLAERDKHLREFIENTHAAAIFQLSLGKYDNIPKVEEVSPVLVDLLHIDQGDSRNIKAWFPKKIGESLLDKMSEAISLTGAFDEEFVINVPATHESRWFRMMVLAAYEHRKDQNRALGILLDITEERLLNERQAEQVEHKSLFLNVLSHQLNTPMNVVKWSTETMLSDDTGELNEKQSDLIKGIKLSSDRMISVLQDVLASLTLVDKKPVQLSMEKLTMADVIVPVLAKNNRLSNRIVKAPVKVLGNCNISGDLEKLQIIFSKIINNAIDYTKDGDSILMEVKKTKDSCLVTITDNGVGIPDKDRPHIFDLFYRGESAMRMQPSRTGLGLSLAKMYAEAHGGDVTLSEDVVNTSFVIEIPLVK